MAYSWLTIQLTVNTWVNITVLLSLQNFGRVLLVMLRTKRKSRSNGKTEKFLLGEVAELVRAGLCPQLNKGQSSVQLWTCLYTFLAT
jgi:hypothetical protein